MTPSAILAHIASLPPTFTADQDCRLYSKLAEGYGLREVAASLGVPHADVIARWAALSRPLIVRGMIPHEAQVALGYVLRGRLA